MKVNSTPNDATVLVNGNEMGKTPTTLNLKRGATHIIEIKKTGFQTFRIETTKSITGWFWGNLICGGILGFVIDLATGNAYDVSPDVVSATLSKSSGMIERVQFEDFTGIQLFDEDGNKVVDVTVVWE